jgi:hypothetical protein
MAYMQNQHFEHHHYIGGFPTGIALSFLVIYGFSYGAEIFPVDMFIKPLEHGLWSFSRRSCSSQKPF